MPIFYIFASSLLQIICCVSAELLLLLLIMIFVDDDMLLLASNISVRHRYALTAKDNKRSRAYLSCKKNKYPNDNVVSISSALLLDSKIPQSANIPCIIGYNSKIFTQVLTRKRYVVAILCKFHKL